MNTLTVQLAGNVGAFSFQADLQVDSFRILGIHGDSAAGKTMLLRGIAGLEPRLKGVIKINHHTWLDSAQKISRPPHQRQIGFVFQEPRLLPYLTVENNLKFAEKRVNQSTSRLSKEDLLECLDLKNVLTRFPDQLSGGQQQRVAIARAILSAPELLLMDEPLSHLNDALKTKIIQMIKHIAHDLKLPILYVTHDDTEITRLASHVTFVQNGQIHHVSPMDELSYEK